MNTTTKKKASLTRRDEAHYVIYSRLSRRGFNHGEAYELATDILADLATCGLSITTRRAGSETNRGER